ncbi:MAG: N-acetyl-alpha-D-glucosaminyl L-malate synthase BshA [Chitinophagales bacterium]|nr:N-acetyl-alpha-D-glucosaminyl L-malate synthase BshA [Chitinophagales bacterium]MDW8394436.1 N-acetyl-alpha-D-glucosaminyl L-malate synthase BshA [Chitinophagales bacterium]
MRIGIVCYPTYGGSGVVATELGKALAEKGHAVHIISYRTPARLDALVENVFYHEVTFADYPLFERAPYETALTSKIVDVARFAHLDLLHVHYAIPHAATAFMAQQMLQDEGIFLPYITTLHGTDITLVGRDATYARVVSFSLNRSNGVTAVSEWLRQETINNFSISRTIAVIPNFVDLKRFRKSPKEHYKKAIAPRGEKILLHTSNFRQVKRIADVIQVFYRVARRLPARLLLVGDGPDRQLAEQLCRDLDVSDQVVFLGKLDPVEDVLAISDLFLLPSQTESFGLAALEAMACQVPVIATRVGGLPELVVDGVTGFLCAVGDVDDMAEKALLLLRDENQLQQFKEQAVQQAARFDRQAVLPRYEAFYEQVLETAGRPVP